MELREVLDQISELTGWTQVQLAKAVGVSQGTISKWRSGQQSPGKEEWDRVADLIKSRPQLEPMRHQDLSGVEVRVMGRIGAGSVIDPDFEQVPPEGLMQVSLPFPVPTGMIAFMIEGESMYPKYDPGDIIVVREDQARSTESFIGSHAAVRTEDGRRFLKRILGGRTRGLYRLESFNAPPMQDIEIAWVGEIHAIVPRDQVFSKSSPIRAKKTIAKSARR